MTKDEITTKTIALIAETLDIRQDEIDLGDHLIEDLDADSLGLVEMILAAEEAFEIDIPDEDAAKIRTVQDAVDYLAGKLGVA